MEKKKFIIVDGQAHIYKAFYAIKGLTNSKGFPTNAILGFTNMLLKILRQNNPDYVVIAFDSIGASVTRQKIYKDYKTNRPSMPKELSIQIPHIKKIVSAYNISQVEKEGYEADDIIATLVRCNKDNEIKIIIVTSDKDLMQLVDEKTVLYDYSKGKFYEVKDVIDKFGVAPQNIIDVLSLMGDSIDNIPGVYGIGEKTAVDLIRKFNSLENLYEHLDQVENTKIRQRLIQNKESAFISKQLLTMNAFVPVDFNLDTSEQKQPDIDKLAKIYEELEFKKFLKDIQKKKNNLQSTLEFK